MFDFWFGLVWVLFSSFVLIIGITGGEADLGATLMMIPFTLIGVVIMRSGIKEISKNRATEKNGKQCFGKVFGIEETGDRVNGKSLYKAKLLVYVPEESTVEIFEESIGFDYTKYPIGSYVSVKYYCGDINFEYSVYEKNVPEYIKQKLDREYEATPIEDVFGSMNSQINTTMQTDTIKIDEETLQNAKRLINKIIGGTLLVFGFFWTFIVAIITFAFYGTTSDVSVNGVMVSHEEYVSMIEPKIFMGLFWVIGIGLIGIGAYNLIKGFWKSQSNSNNEFIGSEYEESEYSEKQDDDDPIRKI